MYTKVEITQIPGTYVYLPDYIFFNYFTGDLLDEGQYVGEADFESYVSRFHSLFSTPKETQVHVVPGNHDMGFHYRFEVCPRFLKHFSLITKSKCNLQEH